VKLICVGGCSSRSGKTSVACLLLKAFPGWAAMKVTPCRTDDVCPRGDDCGACRPPEGLYEVTIDAEIPARPRKDTGRLVEAGASHVAFVRALPKCLPAALESAMDRLVLSLSKEVPGVVIESTTAMPHINGLRILVAREGFSEVKDSARKAAPLVDLFVMNQDASSLREVSAEDFPRTLRTRGKPCVSVCAALGPEHPRNREFVSHCRRFLEKERCDCTIAH